MDGDGVELIAAKDSTAYFDLNGDGIREKVAWISPDDAILVHDKNSNGQIDGISEVFGNGQRDGFEELADYDSNKDRIIDAKDAKFSELRLWQDKKWQWFGRGRRLYRLPTKTSASLPLKMPLPPSI
ncbi:MAG: hypothetical protein OIF54_15855 [Cohaesibacter sp.]|nr:hypothetical protein [Cohaesibacter sp.]